MVVGKHPEPNVYCIKPVNGNGPVQTVNQCQLQDLGKTQNDGGFTSPQNNHDGIQVPSFNPKPMNILTPPSSYPYATCSRRRPPVHSLSTTAGLGSNGFRPAQPQRNTFCSRCTGKSFWIENNTRKCSFRNGSFFYLFYFVGNIKNWQYNSFSFLSPYLARLYGARQVGLGLYHTKVIMTCCDLYFPPIEPSVCQGTNCRSCMCR